ncbi:MAG TPA: hypothetical protein GX705_07455 [Clostridiales bacterium]|nr:hypothetical protein [Clostridiales bacterium]
MKFDTVPKLIREGDKTMLQTFKATVKNLPDGLQVEGESRCPVGDTLENGVKMVLSGVKVE